jgi:hypothetical protein
MGCESVFVWMWCGKTLQHSEGAHCARVAVAVQSSQALRGTELCAVCSTVATGSTPTLCVRACGGMSPCAGV